MARYILLADMAGTPNGGAYQVIPRGTAIADSYAHASVYGDVVWPEVCVTPSWPLAPLDAAASAKMGQPIVTLEALAITPAPKPPAHADRA